MPSIPSILQAVLMILAIVMIFNIIIFVHELGHFLAAKWRGLQVDRFQIWFGKPLWKKEINGVQYGLGWIPAGGFVALPQMAPMEAIEGSNQQGHPLPPISPLDKIIVAFAGPLFSLLLALAAACVVWGIGKPRDFIASQQVGYILPDSPAAKAGFQLGDTITAINGEPVQGFAGSLDSITERIILSRGKDIVFTVTRPGVEQPLTLRSPFETEKSRWFQRRGTRQVGLAPTSPAIIDEVIANSPAAEAGLTKGDRIVRIDGAPLYSWMQVVPHLRSRQWQTVTFAVEREDGSTHDVSLTPERPLQPKEADPMIGISWSYAGDIQQHLVHPNPLTQVADSLRMMWITITSVIAPDSSIGIEHLSGPVGIATMQYDLLKTEGGWRRILGFMVLFNVNLAVLNMLPFPVLDGGHITLAVMEKIARRPVKTRVLEVVQTACALALISLMLYVTSKDVGDRFGRGGGGSAQKVVFPAD